MQCPLPHRLLPPEKVRDRAGRPRQAAGVVDLGGRLTLACAGASGPCAPSATGVKDDVGTAFALGDLDGDGEPELATASAAAPGETDQVTVTGMRGGAAQVLHVLPLGGGAVGVTIADHDGDGALEVIVAERTLGTSEVILWRLN